VHILGYYVDPSDADLRTALDELAAQRLARNARIVDRLNELGFPISFDRVLEIAGTGTVGRPHIARALIEQGYVESIGEAFDRLLANGRPAFVPRSRALPEESVRLIRRSGAVPVLAHPLSAGEVEDTIRRLVPVGLLGIEVFYGEYSAATRQVLAEVAERWRLIPTGGSDYHGPGFKAGRELGSAPVPLESAERLRQQWDALHTSSRS
jgi:predicted metal-dependent phosphoesterase TrpH